MRRYNEALTPLNEAIKIAKDHPDVAYPSIAINSKIDALRGLRRYNETLALSADAMAHLQNASLKGHEFQILMTRAEVYEALDQWLQAVPDCNRSLADARILSYWRGITEAGGFLELAYEHQGQLPEALKAIDEAIDANTHTPDELYFVPRNLAIKAEITQKLGKGERSQPKLHLSGLKRFGQVFIPAWHDPFPQVAFVAVSRREGAPGELSSKFALPEMLHEISDRDC